MVFDSFATLNIAILVLAAGNFLNRKIKLLQDFNIPEPVTSGLLVALLSTALFVWADVEITFDLALRDFLLLYFFAAIGLNSDFKTLLKGGLPLVILVALTVVFLILQNLTGVGVANALGTNPLIGLLGGSVSLVGGHGTSIAWAPIFSAQYGVASAGEIGIACATLGLVVSSLMGGPVARFLIHRHQLEPAQIIQPDVGITYDQPAENITYYGMLGSLFWLNMSLALGEILQTALEALGTQLPLFVCSLFGAILLTNSLPVFFPRLPWPAGGRSLALVSDCALGVFLAMSLMSLQLWTIFALAGTIVTILSAQILLALLYSVFVIFPTMGKNYESAVITAGFAGISLGATPTAMANMTAVTKKYGAAHQAFIVVPLVSGFFVDIANALVITRFLAWWN